jgi:ATP-binding cassette subfamily B protein
MSPRLKELIIMSQDNKARVVKGPGPGGPRGHAKPTKESLKTLKRLLAYVFREYKFLFFIVFAMIIISSLANVIGTLFLRNLIDDYIVPLMHKSGPDFGPLLKMIVTMAAIYYVGVLSTYVYSRIMVTVSQGSLKRIRDDMFSHMETLPVKFFDTHAHGDLMSLYTNDTDTLRQMISQSIPQLLAAVVTVAGTFISMLYLSLPLAGIEVLVIILMFKVVKSIGGKSGKYFTCQQKDLGALNGYIEEMMEGQKVVKVFCHEEEAKVNFDRLNNMLCNSANNANLYSLNTKANNLFRVFNDSLVGLA